MISLDTCRNSLVNVMQPLVQYGFHLVASVRTSLSVSLIAGALMPGGIFSAGCAAPPQQTVAKLTPAAIEAPPLTLSDIRQRLAGVPLLAEGAGVFYVGNPSGTMTAYLEPEPGQPLQAVGRISTGSGMQSLVAGTDGLTVFVSRPFSIEAYAYDPAGEVFVLIDEAETTGEGTSIVVDSEGQYVLVVHGPQHSMSVLLFSNDEGLGVAQRAELGQSKKEVCIRAEGAPAYTPCVEEERLAHYIWESTEGRFVLRSK